MRAPSADNRESTSTLFVKSTFEVPEATVRVEALRQPALRATDPRTLPRYEGLIAAWMPILSEEQAGWVDVGPATEGLAGGRAEGDDPQGDIVEARIELLRRIGDQARVSRELAARLEIVTQRMRALNPGVSEAEVAGLEKVSQFVAKHAATRASWSQRLQEVQE